MKPVDERGAGRSAAEPAVAVLIVTHDAEADLPACFAAVAAQDHRPLELVVVDCASADRSVALARELEVPGVAKQVIALGRNLGFAGGMNEACRRTAAPYLLSLNADARPEPGYVRALLARLLATPRAGAVTGRLVRPAAAGAERRLDACGMYLTRAWRHHDRGSGELDRGRYREPRRVFGATGAATLFARAALEDASVDGELFDAAFHSFREDAELAFRLRERGWEIVYEPAAVAEHRRRVLPARRRSLPPAINYHSLKNRYLLRAYHQTGRNFVRTFFPATVRDLGALFYVFVFERTSLPAYRWLWHNRREILARRRLIQRRRTVPPATVERWFSAHELPL